MTPNQKAEKVQKLIDELGVDEKIDTSQPVQVEKTEKDKQKNGSEELITEYGLDKPGIKAQTVKKTEFIPVKPGENTSNTVIQALLENGNQLVLELRRRPECPSCNYIPGEQGEPGHLTGTCSNCGTQTCPRCKNSCEACGTILCNTCTMGHGVVDETYCSTCVIDVETELRHEREIELDRIQHNQDIEIWELEDKIRRKDEELKQRKLDKEFERSLKAEKLKLEVLKAKIQNDRQMRQQKLQEYKAIQNQRQRQGNIVAGIRNKGDKIKDHPHYD